MKNLMCCAALLTAGLPISPLAAQAAAPQPLSRAAFIAAMDAEFRQIDSNRDGSATRTEIASNQQRIVAANAARRAAAAFASIDTDRNGQISLAEFSKATAGTPATTDPSGVMARLDSNRDSKVTLIEYRTLTLANFDRLDIDKDGVLSAAERRANAR